MPRVEKNGQESKKSCFYKSSGSISVGIISYAYCNLILSRTPVAFYFQMKKNLINGE